MVLENPRYKILRLRKMRLRVRIASFDDRIGFIDEDAASFKRGDIVAIRDLSSFARAGKRLSAWRTRVTPHDLVLLRPAEGWPKDVDFLVEPYRDVIPRFRFLEGGQKPDLPNAA